MRLHDLIRLTRLDKPIGIWLVYFPAAWAVALVAPPWALWRLEGTMLLGAVMMRAAGCVINDLTDRKLDQHVARTRERPLASGAVTRRQALVLLCLLLTAALALALTLPEQVLWLSLLAVPMIVLYPWMKRLTWWPQAFLGITFNLGALFGWLATGHSLNGAALSLYVAALCWTLGYDTIYAVQDMEDDVRIGIRSSAQAIGRHLKPFIAGCYAVMMLCLFVSGLLLTLRWPYYVGLVSAALHAAWQVRQLPPAPEKAGALFRSNQWLGFFIVAGCLLARAG